MNLLQPSQPCEEWRKQIVERAKQGLDVFYHLHQVPVQDVGNNVFEPVEESTEQFLYKVSEEPQAIVEKSCGHHHVRPRVVYRSLDAWNWTTERADNLEHEIQDIEDEVKRQLWCAWNYRLKLWSWLKCWHRLTSSRRADGLQDVHLFFHVGFNSIREVLLRGVV